MKESNYFTEITKPRVAGANPNRKHCSSATQERLYMYTYPNRHQKPLSLKLQLVVLDYLVRWSNFPRMSKIKKVHRLFTFF
jgi:hypothetical protein